MEDIDLINMDNLDTKKTFGYLFKYLRKIDKDVGNICDKVDKLQTVTIINGRGENVETTIQRGEFYQMIYNRINFLEEANKDKFKKSITSLSWWSNKIIPILFILAIILALLGYKELSEQIKRIK